MTTKALFVLGPVLGLMLSSSPAAAQANTDPEVEVGLMYQIAHFTFGTAKAGIAGDYKRQLTQASGSWGTRWGIIAEGSINSFDGTKFFILQAGPTLTSAKLQTEQFKPFANAMFGLFHWSDTGNEKALTFGIGADVPMNGKRFNLRVKVDWTENFYAGGHAPAWRPGFGVVIPLE